MSSPMVNIPSTNQDHSYRYRMPRIQSKIEGRGNGIKTKLLNINDICRCLHINPEIVTRFFAYELGTQAAYSSPKEVATVNGNHEDNKLQQVLDCFIGKFILCVRCYLPELVLSVVSGKVQGVCNACSWSGHMSSNHKLSIYIIKNEPLLRDWNPNEAMDKGPDLVSHYNEPETIFQADTPKKENRNKKMRMKEKAEKQKQRAVYDLKKKAKSEKKLQDESHLLTTE